MSGLHHPVSGAEALRRFRARGAVLVAAMNERERGLRASIEAQRSWEQSRGMAVMAEPTMTREAAAARMQELHHDRQWYARFADPRDPGHQQAKSEYAALNLAMAGQSPGPSAAPASPQAAARARLDELGRDRAWYERFNDDRAEGHREAVEEFRRLSAQMAASTEATDTR